MRSFVFDTETTGLPRPGLDLAKQPYVTEICARVINHDTWEVEHEIDILVKPPIPIHKRITELTGIDDALVADKLPMLWQLPVIKFMLEQSDYVVAHNLPFDKKILGFEFERQKEDLAPHWISERCTLAASYSVNPARKKMSLSKLYKYLFNEEFEGAHRAATDVTALVRIYRELINRGVYND